MDSCFLSLCTKKAKTMVLYTPPSVLQVLNRMQFGHYDKLHENAQLGVVF